MAAVYPHPQPVGTDHCAQRHQWCAGRECGDHGPLGVLVKRAVLYKGTGGGQPPTVRPEPVEGQHVASLTICPSISSGRTGSGLERVARMDACPSTGLSDAASKGSARTVFGLDGSARGAGIKTICGGLIAVLGAILALPAQAHEGDTFRPFVSYGTYFDSNLFRLADNESPGTPRSERYSVLRAGLNVDWKPGRQEIVASAASTRVRYDRNTNYASAGIA